MARSGPQTIGIREGLQAQGEVISTYSRPAESAPSDLHSLASALTNFSKDIGGFLKKKQQEKDDTGAVRGKAAALKSNGMAWAEAVKSGAVPSFESPTFVEGYETTQGEILGKRMAAQFATEYQQWPGRNSQNPEEFDAFVGDFMKRHIQTDNPNVLKGALPYLESVATSGYDLNTRERSTALYNESIDANVASSSMDIDTADDLGVAKGSGTDYDSLWTQLLEQRRSALDTGILEADYDKAFTVMIAQKALEHQDPALLGLLDNKVPGKDFTYATTPEGQKLVSTVIKSMEETNATQIRLKAAEQEAKDKLQQDTNTATAIEQLAADPNHVFDEEFINRAAALDPTFRIKVRDWSATLAKGEPEDERDILDMQAAILRGDMGVEDIGNEMLEGGRIKTSATATKMYNLAQTAQSEALKPLFENQTYKSGLDVIDKALTPPGEAAAWLDPSDPIHLQAAAAKLDYQQSMVAWLQANPEAGYEQIAAQSGTVLMRIQKGFAGTAAAPVYQTPQAVLPPAEGGAVQEQLVGPDGRPAPDTGIPDNPLVPSQQEVVNDFNSQPAENDPYTVWRGDAPPKVTDLSEEQSKLVEQNAKERGISPDVYIQTLYEKLKAKGIPGATTRDGQPLEPDSPAPLNPNDPLAVEQDEGLIEPGTIDTSNRPVVNNEDGTISTEQSFSIDEDGVEVLLPRVIDGKVVSEQEAIKHYGLTGEHLGKFSSPEAADAYAEKLHQQQDAANSENPAPSDDEAAISSEELEEFRQRQQGMAEMAGIETASLSFDAPTDYFPEEEGYMLDPKFNPSKSTVAEIKKVAPILNILGGSEGTDKGEGYNETLAYGAYVDGKAGGKKVKVNLVGMTVKEVRALQRTMLKDPDNKWNSSAVGRYQIVGVTLNRLIKHMGLTGNEKFTPELQDRMALELLRGRGLDKWMAGTLSDDKFLANIAKEWASVPKADGSKTYSDQGLGVTPAKVLAALKQMKPTKTKTA